MTRSAFVSMILGSNVSLLVVALIFADTINELKASGQRKDAEIAKYKTWYTAALEQMSPEQMLKMMDHVAFEGSQK